MSRIIDVDTGQVRFGRKEAILRSNAVGSCVVITAYHLREKAGALAHIMLPGRSPSALQRTKYAADAIDKIIEMMARTGADTGDIETCIIGAANVLKRKDDTVCKNNIKSVTRLLDEKNIKIRAKALGGTKRRSVLLDVANGSVFYAEGDSSERLLWKVKNG